MTKDRAISIPGDLIAFVRTVPSSGAALAGSLGLSLLILAAPASAGPSPERQEVLRHLINQDCGSCHGLTRNGGLGSPLTVEALHDIGDDALAATILDGRPGTPMPPWRGMLSEEDARWIVRHLKGEGP